MLWDEENLYVYATVEDAVLNKQNEEVHQQDSIEVFIDELNTKNSSYGPENKQYRINYDNEHSINGEKCLEENKVTFAKTTDTGYIVEAAFKWTELTPAADTLIGLELQINDADASGMRIGTLSWYDETGTGWSTPSSLGVARLVNELPAAATTSETTEAPADDAAVAEEAAEEESAGNAAAPIAAVLLCGLGAAAIYNQKKQKGNPDAAKDNNEKAEEVKEETKSEE